MGVENYSIFEFQITANPNGVTNGVRQRNVSYVRNGDGASCPINAPAGDMKRLYNGPPLLKNSSVPVPSVVAPNAQKGRISV
jgi:hypothetical protein